MNAILELELKNCFSINEKQVLKFTNNNYSYKNDFVRKLDDDISIVNPVSLYGYNASGKTVLLRALKYAYDILTYNKSDDNVKICMPNLKHVNLSKKEDTVIKYKLFIDGKIVDYTIVSKYFDREYSEVLECCGEKIIDEGFKSNDIPTVLEEYAKRGESDVCKSVYNFFTNIMFIDVRGNVFCKDIKESNRILINNFDNIVDNLDRLKVLPVQKIRENKFRDEYTQESNKVNLQVEFENVSGENIFVSYEQFASNGTKSVYKMLAHLSEYKNTSLLLIDELEHTLHSELVSNFVREFNLMFPETQFIYTTHNTNVLKFLRPDQVYFTSLPKTQTIVKRASSFDGKIREGHNLEKLYNNGYFDLK